MERPDAEELLFDLLLDAQKAKSTKGPSGGQHPSPSPPVTAGSAKDGSPIRLPSDAKQNALSSGSAPPGSLSSLQERLWMVHQLDPACTAYIVPFYLHLRGPLNTTVLEQVLQILWKRHEALRTIFPTRNGQPSREVLPDDSLVIHRHDLSKLNNPISWEEHYWACHAGPLKLDTGPLLRVCLYKITAEHHVLLLDVHHINVDGISLDILRSELFSLYEALLHGRQPVLPPLSAPYSVFIAQETARRASADYLGAVGKRLEELANAPARISFHSDNPISPQYTHQGKAVARRYDDMAFLRRALERGRSEGFSPFVVVLAAFGILLQRHSGQDDLLIGIPVSLRNHECFERTIGFFVNTCVVRLGFSGNPTLREILHRANQAVREMLRCPELPLDVLIRSLRIPRMPDRPPLIQAALSFLLNEASMHLPALEKLDVELGFGARDSAMFELTMDLLVYGSTGLCFLEYRSEMWEERTIRRMIDHFQAILIAIAGQPQLRANEIELMSSPEREELSEVLNGQPLSNPIRLIPDGFLEQCLRQPNRPALISQTITTSYAELETIMALRRGQLARLGLKRGGVMALACAPGLEWTATALAALAEGIVVLPLDTTAPAARQRHILQNSGAVWLWHDGNPVFIADKDTLACPALDCHAAPDATPRHDFPNIHPESTAYLIYTSGTTGLPKGVRVSHGAFAAHCQSAMLAYAIEAGDRMLGFAPPHFDASWEQLFVPLMAGASVLIRDAAIWAPEEWCQRIQQAQATCVDVPPQYLQELLAFLKKRPDCVPRSLRMVISGGEAMPAALAEAWLEGPLNHVSLLNVYGPTEAVVTSTFHRINRDSRLKTANGVVPIGKAMPGRNLYVLNDQGVEVGVGIAGELCLGGPCLADGYQNDDARTQTAFRHWLRTPAGGRWVDPGTPNSVRLYRSGDSVRLGPNNEIEFLGRLDRQVKLRGFRVEPEEIEAVLGRHPAIAQTLVLQREHETQGKQLVAYCVPSGIERPSHLEIAEWLSRWLPDYMIPVATVFLSAFPTTAVGKIDTTALPQPEIRRENLPQPAAASDGLESKIAALWADVLGRSDVGLNDNFFDLGGHSILLVRIHARLEEELGAKVRLSDLFAHSTVARMAKLLRGMKQRLASRQRRIRREDIAIVGLSGRFPGAANVEELWANLAAGKECIRFFTQEELAAAGVPEHVRTRSDYVPAHGYLEGGDLFDAAFFGYTPKEASLIDPQQRLFLEEAWHALENAGCDPSRYPGDIAVFAGMGLSLYLLNNLGPIFQRHDRGAEAFAISLANDKDFITTRVSYKLDLRGPSVNVNTACSTSLVAIHLAAEALLSGECDAALAGGVTLNLPAASGYAYQPGGIASPDGHCRAFANNAAGTVGGSGVGVVVLKRLDQALSDGDTIHAVIKGSAINNDGADKVGFTAPGVNRQRDVIRAALDSGGLSAASIQYLEAHGTGTPMGDPIEIQALCEAFAPDQPAPQSCFIGSIKSNLGHLDTAAGVAGFIKAVLAIEHGQIPPTLHCEHPNSKIGFERTPFRVAQTLSFWPRNGCRRAGVSSFGMGGTNAHVVLEEAPARTDTVPPRQHLWCLPLSARTQKSLLAAASNLARHLEDHADLDAVDLWYTLAEGRRQFPVRTIVLAPSRIEAVAALRALTADDLHNADHDGQKEPDVARLETVPFSNDASFKEALDFAKAWLAGGLSEASAHLPRGPHRRIPLPTYVFDHQVCWIEPPKRLSNDAPAYQEVPSKLNLDDWFYFPTWEQLPARRGPSTLAGSLLVVHNGSAAEQRWLEAMSSAGFEFTVCRSGRELESRLAPATNDQPIPAQVWHLAALGFAQGKSTDYAQRMDALLADIRVLAALCQGHTLNLLFLSPQTGGPGATIIPDFVYLDAAAAVIPREYANIHVKVLRLDPSARETTLLRLVHAAMGLADNDWSLGVWNGQLWRRAFSKLPAGDPGLGKTRLRQSGVYLITGGLGGLGLTVAGYLARSFQARLVLVSRHEPDAAQQQVIAAIESAGGHVRTAALDIADAGALRALLKDTEARWGRLDGVIHAAGVAGGSLVERTHLTEIENVLRPKVAGTEALAVALQGQDPTFVVLFSSLTASLGGPGQIAYAAANAWQDAFAAAQSKNQPGVWTSIEWDSWAEVGMAARAMKSLRLSSSTHSLLKEWSLDPSSFWPWGEHRIGGTATLPGSAYLELLAQALGGNALELGPVVLIEPLVHDGNHAYSVRVGRNDNELFLQSTDGTRLHEHARARFHSAPPPPPALESLSAIQIRCSVPMTIDPRKASHGITIETGPRWAIAGEFRKGNDEALAKLELAADLVGDLAEHALHPALLDVALSFYIACVEDGTSYLPWRYERFSLFKPLEPAIYSHARLRSRTERAMVLDVELRDLAGQLLIQVEGYTLLRASQSEIGVIDPRTEPDAVMYPFSLTPAEGIEALLRALDMAEPVVCVSTVAWKHAVAPAAILEQIQDSDDSRPKAPRKPRPDIATPFRPASTEAEKRMTRVWEEVLGYDGIGIDDDLFDLGADSLTALQASARWKEVSGSEFSLNRFFAKATIENLAQDNPKSSGTTRPSSSAESWEEGEL